MGCTPDVRKQPHGGGGGKVFVLVTTVVLFMWVLQDRCRIWGGHNQARFSPSSTSSLGHPPCWCPQSLLYIVVHYRKIFSVFAAPRRWARLLLLQVCAEFASRRGFPRTKDIHLNPDPVRSPKVSLSEITEVAIPCPSPFGILQRALTERFHVQNRPTSNFYGISARNSFKKLTGAAR